jgi:hypothetical protein
MMSWLPHLPCRTAGSVSTVAPSSGTVPRLVHRGLEVMREGEETMAVALARRAPSINAFKRMVLVPSEYDSEALDAYPPASLRPMAHG